MNNCTVILNKKILFFFIHYIVTVRILSPLEERLLKIIIINKYVYRSRSNNNNNNIYVKE